MVNVAIVIPFVAGVVFASRVVAAQATDENAAPRPARVAFEVNPLPAIILRPSVNVEVLLAEHHALVGNLAYQARLGDLRGGVSGEVGYRLYSGSEGLQGFFAGPSFVMGLFSYEPYERPDG